MRAFLRGLCALFLLAFVAGYAAPASAAATGAKTSAISLEAKFDDTNALLRDRHIFPHVGILAQPALTSRERSKKYSAAPASKGAAIVTAAAPAAPPPNIVSHYARPAHATYSAVPRPWNARAPPFPAG